ncbi:MAG TPA: hypothetical protein VFQ79_12465, partial [Bryobacteraceae bacterium]|nr:hypothetical protein [Bryobacteraceae bacterium]
DQQVFEVQVDLDKVDPNAVRVELFADGVNGGDPVRQPMERVRRMQNAGAYVYRTALPLARPATDYTVRLMPQFDGVAIPLEANRILWQR